MPTFEQFRWSYTGDDAETFTLRVHESDGGRPGALVFERPRLKDTTWTPDEDARAKLPARIVWEVEAYDEFRVSLGSRRSEAWLSGR